MQLSPQELREADRTLEAMTAPERIRWALDKFGDKLILSTSFGIQSAVMLHLATRVNPDIPVIFVDTGYLFRETYLFALQLTKRLNLNLKKYESLTSPAEQEAAEGRLWEKGKDGLEKYNFTRKVEPMNRALQEIGAHAWMAGLRREQAQSRKNLPVLQKQNKTIKIHPIIDWTDEDVYNYIQKYNLPTHPLSEQGYVSVGDWHSTSKLDEGMLVENTRFNGVKRECGLHELSNRIDFQI